MEGDYRERLRKEKNRSRESRGKDEILILNLVSDAVGLVGAQLVEDRAAEEEFAAESLLGAAASSGRGIFDADPRALAPDCSPA